MYVMRPAVPSDRPAIYALVTARLQWMQRQGHRHPQGGGMDARDLAGESQDGWPLAWVLTEDIDQILGCTVLLDTIPIDWPVEIHAQSSVMVSGTYTHPDHRPDRLGRLIMRWAMDHAARRGGVEWVRCVVDSDTLATYLALLGFTPADFGRPMTIGPPHRRTGMLESPAPRLERSTVMQCRAHRVPGLETLVTEEWPHVASCVPGGAAGSSAVGGVAS